MLLVRPSLESDHPAIARIQVRCPEAAQWPIGDYKGYLLLIAFVDGSAAGFCAWRQSAPGEAELLNLGVAPEFRRQGVGAALLAALSSAADGEIFLEVAETNSAAISLYQRLGWVRIGLRDGYYSNGSVNGIVMKKSSC